MNNETTDRRDFLKLSAGLVSSLALPLSLFGDDDSFDDYKALVVIYNSGGNDGFNMFIPSGNDALTGYSNYAKARATIKVVNNPLNLTLNAGELDLSGGNPYASNNSIIEAYTKGFYNHTGLDFSTNALMPELAHLVNQNKVAIVTNVGNLIKPATKAEFKAKTKDLPPFIFAHNHQTKLAMTGEASLLNYSGWAGRIFDNWTNINNGDIYGVNIAVGRSEHLFYGDRTQGLNIHHKGPTKYKDSPSSVNKNIHDGLSVVSDDSMFKTLYKNLRKHSFEMQDVLVDDWKNNAPTFTSTNAYGGTLFSEVSDANLQQTKPILADVSIVSKMEAVAKLAYIGKNRGLKRQIFFVHDGGYDTHNNQSNQHAKKLRGMSLGVGDFYRALKEMNMENEVTTFNISDFGRSIGENGDGTDHAWGNNLFVLGGAVTGGVYGTLPNLTLGGDDDISRKGRLIPTTSMSQYYGTIFKWFGVSDSLMPTILPELSNFDGEPNTISLASMFTT